VNGLARTPWKELSVIRLLALVFLITGLVPGAGAAPAASAGLVAVRPDRAPGEEAISAYFRGTIGEGTPVQMSLAIRGEEVTGWYMYDRIGSPLTLAGSAKPDESGQTITLALKERTGEGKETGKFEGKFRRNQHKAGGAWTDAEGTRHLNFALTQVATTRTLRLEQGGTVESTVTFPWLLGADDQTARENDRRQANAVRAATLTFAAIGDPLDIDLEGVRLRAPYFRTEDWELAFLGDEAVSLKCRLSFYTGGAHPNTEYGAENRVLSGGVSQEVRLTDLFLQDAPVFAELSRLCTKELARQRAPWVLDGSAKLFAQAKAHPFTLSPAGITFIFAPYVVGPYSNGAYSATVPWSAIEPMLNPAGPARYFRAAPK
jgi:hypothetical protein